MKKVVERQFPFGIVYLIRKQSTKEIPLVYGVMVWFAIQKN